MDSSTNFTCRFKVLSTVTDRYRYYSHSDRLDAALSPAIFNEIVCCCLALWDQLWRSSE